MMWDSNPGPVLCVIGRHVTTAPTGGGRELKTMSLEGVGMVLEGLGAIPTFYTATETPDHLEPFPDPLGPLVSV